MTYYLLLSYVSGIAADESNTRPHSFVWWSYTSLTVIGTQLFIIFWDEVDQQLR